MTQPDPHPGLARRVGERVASRETFLIVLLTGGVVLGLLFSPGIGRFAVWVPVAAAAVLACRWLGPAVDAASGALSKQPSTRRAWRTVLYVAIAAAVIAAGVWLVVTLVPRKP